MPWRCVWGGLGVPLSCREGWPLGCEGRPGNSGTFLHFTVGGNVDWKCLYKGVLPTVICMRFWELLFIDVQGGIISCKRRLL